MSDSKISSVVAITQIDGARVTSPIHWGLIAFGGIVVVGGVILTLFMSNRRDTSLAKAWIDFDSIQENEKLANFAEEQSRNPVGSATHLKMARQQLALGLREYPAPMKETFSPSPDSPEAKSSSKTPQVMAILLKARDGFDLALKGLSGLPALELECKISAGRASEALENVPDARRRYNEVVEDPRFKDSAVAREVRLRVKEMDDKGRWEGIAQLEKDLRQSSP